MALAAASGAVSVAPLTILEIVLARFGVAVAMADPTLAAIVWEIRLPRVVAAGLVGAALALAGVLTQGLFRNPLAEPYILGMSGGAGFAVTAFLAFATPLHLNQAMSYLSWVGAFGGLITIAIVYALASRRGRVDPLTILLAGLAMSAILGALTTALLFMGDPHLTRLARVWSWMGGGVQVLGWGPIAAAVPPLGLGIVVALRQAAGLDALALGEESAAQLGIAIQRQRVEAIVGIALLAGAAVTLAGLIGFVGLVVPHIMRLIVGPRHLPLLIANAPAGAAFVVLADLAARTLLPPAEIPLSVITALVGGPWFLYLLRARRGFVGAIG
ncbi:MAG: iron ABC transporter permease [Chloroflexi bacterium]|nr:iron ABC transporter permease [Chloroflexota bacterium]